MNQLVTLLLTDIMILLNDVLFKFYIIQAVGAHDYE
jgi:hypothetical protein